MQHLNMADLIDLKTYIYKEIDKKEKRINYYAASILLDWLLRQKNIPEILRKCKITSIDSSYYYPTFELDYISYQITFNKNQLIYRHIFKGDYLKIDISIANTEYSPGSNFINSKKIDNSFKLLAEYLDKETERNTSYEIKELIYYLDKLEISSVFWKIKESLENNYIIEPLETVYRYRNVYPFSMLNKDVFNIIVEKILNISI